MTRNGRRLRRQFEELARRAPPARGLVERLCDRTPRILRLPIAVLLVLGGMLSFLPVLGFWMLPLGLMLLALDIPWLAPRVSAAAILTRRRASVWWRTRVARRRRARSGSGPRRAL